MIADQICNLLNTFIGRYKQMFGTFQTDLLDISGISKSGFPLDQPVEVIFLVVKLIYQILDGDVLIMSTDEVGNLLKYDPVHCLLLLFGK